MLSDFQVLEFEHKLNKDGESDDDGLTDLEELTGARNGNVDSHVRWVDLTGMLDKAHKDKQAKGETTKDFDAAMKDLAEKNPGIFKYEGGKCLYKTYDYNSNPMLNDTDFDGLQDNIDSNEIDGTFKGSANNIGQVEYVSDFRYFFVDNNQYNDELSTMSLMMSNLANGGTAPMHGWQMSIGAYLESENFSTPLHKTSFKISDTENISGDLYLAKKTIQVGANKKAIKRYKDVYGVFLGGFNNKNAYRKLLVNINDEDIDRYYKKVTNDIMSYIKTNMPTSSIDNCYWITGYGISGSIANMVAKELLDEGKEVYCYTFGATLNNVEGVGSYSAIKNIINEDMLEHKLLEVNNKFSMYGTKYNSSIKNDYMREYINKFGKDYQGNYKLTNFISKEYENIRNNLENTWFYDKFAGYLYNGSRMWQEGTANTEYFGSLLDSNKKAISDGKSLKSYYILSKNLNGFRTSDNNQEYDEIYITPDSNETKVIAKDLVLGDGTKEKPYYSDTQSLSFDTIEDEFWCKFEIEGATDVEYVLPSDYMATVYTTKIYDEDIIRVWDSNSSGEDLIYKLEDINNYTNKYLVQLSRISSADIDNHIEITFAQHLDINRLDQNVVRWERDEESVQIHDDKFVNITYSSKEYAPTIVTIELNQEDDSFINSLVNGIIKAREVTSTFLFAKRILTFAVEAYSGGGLLALCNKVGALIIKDTIKDLPETILKKILSNRYSTKNYKKDLIDESGYHLLDIIAYVNEPAELAICDHGIVIYERTISGSQYFLGYGEKYCERWDEDLIYGAPGVVGRWIDEND